MANLFQAAFISISPTTHWRRYSILLLTIFFLRGLSLLCVMPPCEGWDEYQHVLYVAYVHDNPHDPIFGQAMGTPDCVAAIVRLPLPDQAVRELKQTGARSYQSYWRGDPFLKRPIPPTLLYEAQQPPLYYRLASPIFSLAGGAANIRAAIGALRLANLIFVTLSLAVALWAFGRWDNSKIAPATVGLWISLQPLFLINCVRVANDALAVGSAIIFVSLLLTPSLAVPLAGRSPHRPGLPFPNLFRPILLGLILGLAIYAKVFNLALVPFALIYLLCMRPSPESNLKQRLTEISIIFAAAFLATFHYFSFNLHTFGVLTPMQETLANHQAHRTPRDALRAALQINWPQILWRWWTKDALWVGGWSFVKVTYLLTSYYAFITTASLLGACLVSFLPERPRRRRRDFERQSEIPTNPSPQSSLPARACLLLCLCFTAALAYHAIQSQEEWGGIVTGSWYAAGAIPWFLIVVYYAAKQCRTSPWLKWIWCAVIDGLPPVFILTEACGLFIGAGKSHPSMIEYYSNSPVSFDALHRLATMQPAALGVFTFLSSAIAQFILILLALGAWFGAPKENR